MKNTNGILAFAALMILLSSCGSLSISQKRYSRGLNIDWFSKKDEPRKTPQPKVKKVKEAPAENAVAEQIPVSQEFESVEEIQTVQNAQNNSNVTESPSHSNATSVKKQSKAIKKAAAFKAKELRKELKQQLNISKKTEAGSESNADDNLILLVILAILLPPLAVYLFYGSPETHFWINLILWLLFGGIFFIFGGGFYGVGIAFIHALLVIFEVIG